MVLFDLKARDWSGEVLSTLDIPRAWIPKTFEGTEFTGYVHEETTYYTKVVALTLQFLDKREKEEPIMAVDEDPGDYDIE